MTENKILLVVLLLINVHKLVKSDKSHAHCGPRLTILQTDKEFPSSSYWPFFIQVHRCGGSCSLHPTDQKCAPLTSDTIKVPLYDRNNGMLPVFVAVKNHTSCGCACTKSAMDCRFDLEDWNQDQCRCTCRYANEPPEDLKCKPGFRWDKNSCRCSCNKAPTFCPFRKEWNAEACDCTCSKRVVNRCQRKMKGLDYDSCECVDVQALRRGPSTSPKSGVYTSVFIVLGVVVFVLACVVIHLIIKLQQRPKLMTFDDEIVADLKTPPSVADSGNMTCSNESVGEPRSEVKENYQTNSNGSVVLTTQLSQDSRESTL